MAQPASSHSSSTKIMTPSNVITLVRICLVPVFIAALLSPWPEWFALGDFSNETKSLVAAVIFIIISGTDWIDGYLARTRNEISDFGKFVDPLADKILVAAALIALVELGVLPSWPVLIILAREFVVAGVRMIAASNGEVIAASWYGKVKTVFQVIAVVLFLVKDSFFPPVDGVFLRNPLYILSWVAMIIALIFTIISMLDYLSKARQYIGFSSTSAKQDADKIAPIKDEEGNYLRDENGNLPATNEFVHAISAHVIAQASKYNLSICTAESLTGGMISAALTAIPGSSSVVRGAIVSYVNDVKHEMLDVDAGLLEEYGAVNARTACEMACGACSKLEADIGIAVTGIAGPGGAEEGKPVGTVWIAVHSSKQTSAFERHFSGDRADVRMQTVAEALVLLYERIQLVVNDTTEDITEESASLEDRS